MGVCEVDHPEEYGVVELQDDHIIHIHEKVKDPVSRMINAGIYHFTRDIFDYIKRTGISRRGEYELTDAINLCATDKPVRWVVINKWRDIGYPWDLFDATREVLEELSPKINGTVEPYATVKGPVIIGENTVVMNGSYITGPVIIGKNCKIGPNCYIRPYTAIGDGCHIGGASEVKNSIIMNESNVPHHNYVGDSVIGSGCNLGSGTKVANLRLDKKNIYVEHIGKRMDTNRRKLGVIMGDQVQTGINSVINVGSIIGDSVFIGPGSVVSGTIDSNTHIL
jgi:bifunctional UDP-N-acetylglucosamine pyrophosphorylase/glucosamine-1-phosphate N-acetyltransferase